nr:EOG090X058A [Cyclestheria hislopi]
MADLFIKYRCGYCQDEILGIRIRCSVCSDYELCLQCFSLGCEAGPHKASHAYKFMDPGTFSLFPESNIQVRNKNQQEPWSAQEEYQLLDAIEQFGYGNWEDVAKHIETRTSEESQEHYCERFVNGTIGRATWPNISSSTLPNGEPHLNASDHTCPDNGPLSPTITSRLPPLIIQPEEALQLGYMPQRDDFEREHDNEAEAIVSHLAINHDDEDIEIALKLAQVDMYTRRLRERARRKRVARDFQLVSQFFSSLRKEKEKPAPAAKKRESQKDREMQEKFRVFSQFQTAAEHEQFLRNLAKERALRLRIRELLKYRRNGLTRQDECTEYERTRYFRERRREARQQRQRKKSRKRRSASCKFSRRKVHNEADRQEAPNSLFKYDDLTLCPGSELLTPSERQICQSLRLRPLHYLSFKTNLLLNGTDKAPLLPGLALDEQRLIIHYFTKAGFLSVDG